MENFFRILNGVIPKDFYAYDMQIGQGTGVIVTLTGKKNIVEFDFGLASAVKAYDEGIANNFYPNIDFSEEIKCGFENVIYEIQGDEFLKEVLKMSGGALSEKKTKHFFIVTFFYIVDIVGEYLDDEFFITINGIRHSSKEYL